MLIIISLHRTTGNEERQINSLSLKKKKPKAVRPWKPSSDPKHENGKGIALLWNETSGP